VSGVEILNYLKKSLGVITKIIEESGVVVLPGFADHSFTPLVKVPDTGVALEVSGRLVKVKNIGDAPVYANFDRPVGSEYTVVFPGSYILVPRLTQYVHLKAPTGYTATVSVEVLR
jgi:hypothetical protein